MALATPAALADDPSGILRRNLQPQDHPFAVYSFGHLHIIGIFDQGFRHEFDQLFHLMLALAALQ